MAHGLGRSDTMQRIAGLAGCLPDDDLDRAFALMRVFVIILQGEAREQLLRYAMSLAERERDS